MWGSLTEVSSSGVPSVGRQVHSPEGGPPSLGSECQHPSASPECTPRVSLRPRVASRHGCDVYCAGGIRVVSCRLPCDLVAACWRFSFCCLAAPHRCLCNFNRCLVVSPVRLRCGFRVAALLIRVFPCAHPCDAYSNAGLLLRGMNVDP